MYVVLLGCERQLCETKLDIPTLTFTNWCGAKDAVGFEDDWVTEELTSFFLLEVEVQEKELSYDNGFKEKKFENRCIILNEINSQKSLKDAIVCKMEWKE